ncbi:MFS transporter [Mycolicibacterium litorale]|uniref:MFS transporter n=1 Tax=Mycolicibacterium litorale TaxID=758802 RepID=A0AAD1IJV8_9MYCO|nr:MFS transporter [Mycolicibacterium litorale]MCV7415869.1 MFS transporter [Mycolicibacterium litorale]TDY09120.1 putative MFS family arabinose efflux permease [Mycolicibacterium litorale]BBY17057.1 MFS transporter [Mycolicibacterium litorale]
MQRSFYFVVGAGACLIGCCYGFARFAYGLFSPVFTDTFELTSTAFGLIGAGSYVGYCAAIVLSIVLTERLGPRRVAVGAGVVATVGISTVAAAPSTLFLAVGILVAGCSTGIASPPLAAAVAHLMRGAVADRAQTIVNAGTGIGVVVSGPVALLLFGHWRIAWALFAAITAVVTVWAARVVPSVGATEPSGLRERTVRPGTFGLVVASLIAGVASIAVWNFGREVITSVGGAGPVVSSVSWTVLGAAGIAGAFGGALVARIGLRPAWVLTTVAMAAATLALAVGSTHLVVILAAPGMFGAAYVAMSGLLLLWSVRVYPDRTAFGVGLSFFTLAVGQALGAPAVGALIDSAGAQTAFGACAVFGLLALLLRPATEDTPVTAPA